MRPSGRKANELRTVILETGVSKHAEGSCLIRAGDTHVLCTASIEDSVPRWIKNTGKGWITAEYGMLPRATSDRTEREAKKGQTGRTHEIQRLIGRSLRGAVDLKALGEYSIKIDCDVLQADGGTRTASVTGGYVALHLALQKLYGKGLLRTIPILNSIAAVSCGIYDDEPVLDLDYVEDSAVSTDSNFVMTGEGGIVEIQGTAEKKPFTQDMFLKLLALAAKGTAELSILQKKALGL